MTVRIRAREKRARCAHCKRRIFGRLVLTVSRFNRKVKIKLCTRCALDAFRNLPPQRGEDTPGVVAHD